MKFELENQEICFELILIRVLQLDGKFYFFQFRFDAGKVCLN